MRIGNKGLEIPVNLLVILAISIIVLLSAVVFFLRGFTPASQNVAAQQDFNNCASSWVRIGCEPTSDQFQCSDGRSLFQVGGTAGFKNEPAVRKAANCPDTSTSTGGGAGTGGVSSGPGATGPTAPPS